MKIWFGDDELDLEDLKAGDNIYRTENFIVKQNVKIMDTLVGTTIVMSFDTFYYRTPERDDYYEEMLMARKFIEGRRTQTNTSIRIYVK